MSIKNLKTDDRSFIISRAFLLAILENEKGKANPVYVSMPDSVVKCEVFAEALEHFELRYTGKKEEVLQVTANKKFSSKLKEIPLELSFINSVITTIAKDKTFKVEMEHDQEDGEDYQDEIESYIPDALARIRTIIQGFASDTKEDSDDEEKEAEEKPKTTKNKKSPKDVGKKKEAGKSSKKSKAKAEPESDEVLLNKNQLKAIEWLGLALEDESSARLATVTKHVGLLAEITPLVTDKAFTYIDAEYDEYSKGDEEELDFGAGTLLDRKQSEVSEQADEDEDTEGYAIVRVEMESINPKWLKSFKKALTQFDNAPDIGDYELDAVFAFGEMTGTVTKIEVEEEVEEVKPAPKTKKAKKEKEEAPAKKRKPAKSDDDADEWDD